MAWWHTLRFAHPLCGVLSAIAADSAERVGATVHRGGTYVCMEGPQFSTVAESNAYRQWGMDIIGMTNLQEAKLAREAEICYVTIALVTDYDCWHPDHDSVTVEHDHPEPDRERRDGEAADCGCRRACAGRAHVPVCKRPRNSHHHPARCRSGSTKRELAPIVGKYLT